MMNSLFISLKKLRNLLKGKQLVEI